MTLKIGINGFGRIGRNIVRAFIENVNKDIQIVAINDLAPIDISAHLLEYDSVHGPLRKKIDFFENKLVFGKEIINYSSYSNPMEINWGKLGVELVLECTGVFSDSEKAKLHISGGAKKVIVSAPCNNADKTIVYGVNHKKILKSDKIVSAASCTTNCLAPMVSVLDNQCGIDQGFMTTIHAYTQDQRVLDSFHKDKYRARSAAQNIIPTSTGAAKAVGLVLPSMEGKLDGVAVRVPTPNVSAVDFVFMPKNLITAEKLNQGIILASKTSELKGILDYTDKALVSSDLTHNPASSIFHLDQTKILDTGMVRVFSWYDNEWGFSNRMLDISNYIFKEKLI